MKRCLEEAQKMQDLREGVLDNYLYNNANRLFWPTAD